MRLLPNVEYCLHARGPSHLIRCSLARDKAHA